MYEWNTVINKYAAFWESHPRVRSSSYAKWYYRNIAAVIWNDDISRHINRKQTLRTDSRVDNIASGIETYVRKQLLRMLKRFSNISGNDSAKTSRVKTSRSCKLRSHECNFVATMLPLHLHLSSKKTLETSLSTCNDTPAWPISFWRQFIYE